jgi:hypothetical protein
LALEIDSAVNDLVRHELAAFSGGLFAHPEVELVDAEARSYLAATDERFDAIISFHTISNAALATGALGLAENYLLTTEAMATLLGRLADDGLLLVSRPEAQLARLARTIASAWPFAAPLQTHVLALAEAGPAPAFVSVLLVSRRPLTVTDEEAARQLAGRVLYSPSGDGTEQALFATALDHGGATTAASQLGRSHWLTPATDDRPFFNLHRAWADLRPSDFTRALSAGHDARLHLEDRPLAQVAALLVLLELLLLGVPLLVVPLRRLRKAGIEPRLLWRTGLYFGGVGVGFMLVEVALVQLLTRLTGLPAWSLVTVLATLLLGTGAGSLLLAERRGASAWRAAVGAAGIAIVVGVLVPPLVSALAPLGFAARIATAAVVVFALALPLGAPFATGLRHLPRRELVALAWGVNGLGSVAGTVGALIVSSAIGLSATALLAAVAYAFAAWCGRAWRPLESTS